MSSCDYGIFIYIYIYILVIIFDIRTDCKWLVAIFFLRGQVTLGQRSAVSKLNGFLGDFLSTWTF